MSAASQPEALVGRRPELDRLIQALGQAASRAGNAFFITGEAGIGKTRLGRELASLAQQRGFLVLAGRAFPLERGLAYGLILDAFGPTLRSLDSVRQSTLVSGLDDLGRLFASLHLPRPEPVRDLNLEKTRLFEAVARLVERLAHQHPLLLFLDDVHWADPASLEMLHYLARNLAGLPVLLLATYRSEEAEAARGLRALLDSLHRSGLAESLSLPRLEPSAVAQLAKASLGGSVPDELLDALNARADGTPLYVLGLLRAFLDSGKLRPIGQTWVFSPEPATALPPGVRDLILERLRRLHPSDRNLLNLIAASGDDPPYAVLRVASELDEAALLAAADRLRVAGLVAEETRSPDVVYHLTHPLVQEVAYAELTEMTRRRAHASLAAAFEAVRPDDVDRLAYHYRGAGAEVDPARALETLLAAGERARELHANEEAAQHFAAALGVVRAGHRPALLPGLLEKLGEAWDRVGEAAAAISVWSEARGEYGRAGDVVALGRLCRWLALAEWDRGHFSLAQDHLDAGLGALAGSEPSEELADLIHTRVIFLGRLGDFRGVEAASAQLLALAEQLGAPRARAEALLGLAAAALGRGDLGAAREHAGGALAVAEAGGESLLAQRAEDMLSLLAWFVGDHRLARLHAERSLARAQRLQAPTLALFPHVRVMSADLAAGAWEDVRQRSLAALAIAYRVGQPRGAAGILAVRALLLAHLGELEGAEVCLAEARHIFGSEAGLDRNVSAFIDMVEVTLALERGDAGRAIGITRKWPPHDRLSASLGRVLVVEAQLASGQPERALEVAQAPAPDSMAGNPWALALAAYAEGLARQALGQAEAARVSLEKAIEAFAALEMPFETARAQLAWARVVGTIDPSAVVVAAQRSLAVFEQLGARKYGRRARQLLRQFGIQPPAARRPPASGPLSAREMEVARLVAEGLTTAEIARRLVISPRTVTTHLDRIYARLNIKSRAALARYMAEAGLLPPAEHNT